MDRWGRRAVITSAGAALVVAPLTIAAETLRHDRAAGDTRSPGPRTPAAQDSPIAARAGVLRSADVMVFAPATLSDRVIGAIDRLSGVVATLPIAFSQVSVQDQLLVLAAADPQRFRAFTPYATAEDRRIWERVASGQLAVDPTLRHTLPADGVVRLGAASSALSARIGAWAPQISGAVHMAGDPSWIQRLSMVPRNGLLVSTGMSAPDEVVRRIRALVGRAVTVQRLDVVAREGLDPSALQTAYVVGSVAEAIGHYTYSVASLSAHGDVVTPDPAWVREHIVTDAVPILGPVTGNRLFFPQLQAAMGEIVDRGLAARIIKSEYGGCYFPRFIAGTHVLSNHAFGLAIDLNVAQNQRGTPGHMDPAVVETFDKWGFTWGGTWSYTDPMHFEINRLVSPGRST